MELIRQGRLAAGLTQAELAEAAGTSQPTLAAYEAGRAEPRIATLARLLDAAGCDLVVESRPRVRRGAMTISEAAISVGEMVEGEGPRKAWRALLDFVDDFRGSSTAGRVWLVTASPAPTGHRGLDAGIAGLIEFLCEEGDIPYPAWTDETERFVEPWWFVSGLRGFQAMALRDTPVPLARHGVFVNEGAFDRV